MCPDEEIEDRAAGGHELVLLGVDGSKRAPSPKRPLSKYDVLDIREGWDKLLLRVFVEYLDQRL